MSSFFYDVDVLGTNGDCCENGNVPSSFIKGAEFLD